MKRQHSPKPSNKLFLSKRRTIVGALLLADHETTADPNAIYMSKQHSRMLYVSQADMMELQTRLGYSERKAVAYYEAVTQLPFHRDGEGGYTNREHEQPPTNPGVTIDVSSIEWFANAWKGNSWAKSMRDGGPPCFWTKDLTNTTDAHTTSWRTYEKNFPGRGARIAYDKHDSYHKVLAALRQFLHRHPTGAHVWIQGNLNGMGPAETVNSLRADIMKDAASNLLSTGRRDLSFDQYWRSDLEASTDVLYYYGGRPPQSVPVIPWRVSNFGMRTYGASLRPQLFPSSTWMSKNGKRLGDIVRPRKQETYRNYSEFVNMVPITREDKLDFGWKQLDGGLYEMAEIVKGLTYVDGDTLVSWPSTPRFWEVEEYAPFEDRAAMLRDHASTLRKYMASNPDHVILFNAGVDFASEYTELVEGVIVIPEKDLRRNLQMRAFHGDGMHPTDLDESLIAQRDYARILPVVDGFESITTSGLYMAAPGAGKTTFVEARDGVFTDLLKVNDPSFFMGLGSVSTAQNGSFGLGRDEASLTKQAMRRLETGHDTSGHMIASVLCPTSHLLWYLEEVYINNKEKKSIYNVPFKEPTGALYHSIEEYRNALIDMKELEVKGLYPSFARNNVEVCRTFVSLIS